MFDLQKDLEKSMKVQDLYSFLVHNNEEFEILLTDCTISQIFLKLRKFTSFFDYSIPELLIDKFGSNVVKRKLDEYKESFTDFSKRRVNECPGNAFGDYDESEKVWVIKTDKIINKMTVEELKCLNIQINKVLGCPIMRLLHVVKGCVELIFRVLKDEILILSEQQRQALQKLGVESINCGDLLINTSVSGMNVCSYS